MSKKIIILSLIVAIIALVIINSYFNIKTPQTESLIPIPIFNPNSSPRGQSVEPIINPNSRLTLLNIVPSEDTLTQFSPTQQIELIFNNVVPADKLHIEISPNTSVSVKSKLSDPKSLLIYPDSSWVNGITTLTIFGDTQTEKGSFLENKIIYKINTGLPDYSNFTE